MYTILYVNVCMCVCVCVCPLFYDVSSQPPWPMHLKRSSIDTVLLPEGGDSFDAHFFLIVLTLLKPLPSTGHPVPCKKFTFLN